MKLLKKRIEKELGVPTYYPANGTIMNIPVGSSVDVEIPVEILEKIAPPDKSELEVSLKLRIDEESGRSERIVVAGVEDMGVSSGKGP